MKHWCVWVWFTAGLFMACSSENQWLDTALNLAGDNRAELQKVLDRYKEEDGDKYRAACFLIENMPYHYGYEDARLDRCGCSRGRRKSGKSQSHQRRWNETYCGRGKKSRCQNGLYQHRLCV